MPAPEKALDGSTGTDAVGLDRILFFSDAVVAIAITLLALPLVDAALEHGPSQERSAALFLHQNGFDLVAAAISFFMIAAAWRANHRLFRDVTGYTEAVVTIDFLWIASILALPIATALLVVGSSTDRLTLALYLGAITVSAALTRLQEEVLRRGGLIHRPPESRRDHLNGWLPVIARALATVLSVVVPQIGLWSLLALVPATAYGLVTGRPARRRG
jgi:uncharacterized membrane protein